MNLLIEYMKLMSKNWQTPKLKRRKNYSTERATTAELKTELNENWNFVEETPEFLQRSKPQVCQPNPPKENGSVKSAPRPRGEKIRYKIHCYQST